MISLLKNKVEKGEFLFVFFLVYFTNSAVIFSLKNLLEEVSIIYLLVVVIIFVFSTFSYRSYISFDKRAVLLFITLVANVLLSAFINFDSSLSTFWLISSILNGFLVSTILDKQTFYKLYVRVMYILSIFSLFATIIIIKDIESLQSVFKVYTNTNGIGYLNMYLAIPITTLYRNNGVFGEPGMYQVFLTFALVCELFLIKKKPNMIKVSIFLFTMFTTFSPAAIMQGAILMFAFILKNKNNIKDNSKLLLLICSSIGLIVLLFNIVPEIRLPFDDMYRKLFLKEMTYTGRKMTIFKNIQSGLQSPIWGQGITKGFQNTMTDYLSGISGSNTSTTTILFVLFGISFPTLITYMQFKLSFMNKENILIKIMIFIVLVMSINSQLLIYDSMLYIICFSVFMKDKENKFENTYQ